MSSRQAVIDRRLKKLQEAKEARERVEASNQTVSVSERPVIHSPERMATPVTSPPKEPEGELPKETRKRNRANEEMVKTYTPQWGVLATDSVALAAPQAALEVGPDLCRGMILPADRSTYEKLSAAKALTEAMALISMVKSFPLLPFSILGVISF